MAQAATAHEEGREATTALDEARLALEQAQGSPVDACTLLVNKAKQDRQLYELFIPDSILRDQIWLALRKAMMRERKDIWQEQEIEAPSPVETGKRVHLLALSHATSLLAMRLPLKNLPVLGDATREELREAITFYLHRANDMLAKGRFLALVEKRLPDGTRVREKFTEKKLREMQQSVMGEASHAA